MAMRSVLSRSSLTPCTARAAGAGGFRFLSDGKGRVLSEEERAAENVYIQKMERERLEKLRLKAEKEKAEKEKEQSEKVGGGIHHHPLFVPNPSVE
ncbi:putative uncharacterized transmembrane protein [Cucumis melo var. makuwa]|uniref:Uncharacterized transmembrane protein n=1 Tax=Cucumis melo var. makuwa TaxID=1194695 RepID=A0A5D3CIM5_CUCMM|nr:putative uncharacterized transmembrane protein [Cucumis melo var. makuwa]